MPGKAGPCKAQRITGKTMTDKATILLSTKAAAALLGVSFHTLRRWRKEGIGPPCVRKRGMTIMYNRVELERWALSQNGSAAKNTSHAPETE